MARVPGQFPSGLGLAHKVTAVCILSLHCVLHYELLITSMCVHVNDKFMNINIHLQ